jgi:nucleoside-diphosphate-sugar epimerase
VSLLKQPIFVTGATGFIGGRLCERLAQESTREIRALVHNLSRAARIARLPVQLCPGDLLDRESLRRALAGAKTVVHLGLGYGQSIVKGTRNILEVAQTAGVERFVHMSTTAVYGLKPPPGCETEETPTIRTGDVYCDNKLRAELAVTDYAKRGLPVVILRPSIVFGPYSGWSTRLVDKLRQGKVALIDQGKGACNTVYVDNLVDAILLALENERAVGQTFFITDGEEVSWGDFIRAHAAMIAPPPRLSQISGEQILAFHRRQPGIWKSSLRQGYQMLMSPEFRQMVRCIPIGDRMITWGWSRLQTLGPEKKDRIVARLRGSRNGHSSNSDGGCDTDLNTWAIQSGTVVFSISKARSILGFEPRIPFAEGIGRTEQWLRFANYL